MERPIEPEITEQEVKLFKIALLANNKTIKEWADDHNYRPQFIRQILCNDRRSNYARLLIRSYIKDSKEIVTKTVN